MSSTAVKGASMPFARSGSRSALVYVDKVTVGLVLLALAVLLSLYKGGLLRRFWPLVCRINAALRDAPA